MKKTHAPAPGDSDSVNVESGPGIHIFKTSAPVALCLGKCGNPVGRGGYGGGTWRLGFLPCFPSLTCVSSGEASLFFNLSII